MLGGQASRLSGRRASGLSNSRGRLFALTGETPVFRTLRLAIRVRFPSIGGSALSNITTVSVGFPGFKKRSASAIFRGSNQRRERLFASLNSEMMRTISFDSRLVHGVKAVGWLISL